MGAWFRWRGEELALSIRLQPRAARDEVMGAQGDRLKVRVSAPPVEGAANERLMRLLAREFGVPRSRVSLLTGARGRDKRVAVRRPLRHPAWLR
ncbi:MAG: YggU family protein [Gammaproteobacteria bacterium]|nr:YggU family protein [Gammaproteobacteria bacterium]NIR82720.1 YggU family protein [Gammaproteobacteria bacterium]NIR89584.1 YggU family protein [Gammaproteobacteria bacterium]NIU03880.1 YggU family protein [Gammaproteobacteria bacterium]NIV51196.1 YggU family protein [Gammaproteobacteria bacterium]